MNANDYNDHVILEHEFCRLRDEFNRLRHEHERLNYDHYYLNLGHEKLISCLNDSEYLLDSIDFKTIESYVRKHKLRIINEK